jgi:hypothetical protein
LIFYGLTFDLNSTLIIFIFLLFRNRKFKQARPNYRTEAESSGWTWVFKNFVDENIKKKLSSDEHTFWVAVKGAQWNDCIGSGKSNYHTT